MNYRNVLLFLLVTACFSLHAQREEAGISHYILPEFSKGTVWMKNGIVHQALLNYNVATEEMVFDQTGQKLAMDKVTLSQLDTVFIQDRKFVLIDKNKFAELIHQDGYTFLAQYRCKVIPPGKSAAYGGTSQTSSTTSYSSWASDGRVYQLKLPDDFKINLYNVYWIDNGGGLKSFSSLGQIKKFYNRQKEIYNQYTGENKVDFSDPESVAGLVQFMETNKQ